ncbi:MAG TPA: hypothetical protein VGO63_02095 [Candidatus Paceibacterota bacterium]|jgi:cytochrome c oxidase assembly factor CtaG|nr:hypothetical protein [Candidatus Paceibacterota bacterium]
MEENVGEGLGSLTVLVLAFYFITLVQKKKKEDNWKPIILLFLSFLVGSNIAYLGNLSGYYTLGITIGVFMVSLIYKGSKLISVFKRDV